MVKSASNSGSHCFPFIIETVYASLLSVGPYSIYPYRAVDSAGASVDFLPSAQRDADAAKQFFQKVQRDGNRDAGLAVQQLHDDAGPIRVRELTPAKVLMGARCDANGYDPAKRVDRGVPAC